MPARRSKRWGLLTLGCLASPPVTVLAQAGPPRAFTMLRTLAGQGGQRASTDGAGALARFNSPHGVAVDAAGTVYVADMDGAVVRRITPAGEVSTLAGQAGLRGSRDGAGTAVRFDNPSGVAVDGRGLLYVADNHNQTLRRITPGGTVLTLAGTAGHKGDADGPGSRASFRAPAGVAADAAGNLYVADYLNSTIRRVTPQGEVSTVAGVPRRWRCYDGPLPGAGLLFPFGVAVGPDGRVYVAESGSGTVRVLE